MFKRTASSLLRREVLESSEKWLRRTLAIVSIGFILLFLYTAFRRIGYHFSFDQIEGGNVTSVLRIAHGYPLYAKPTLDFVPHLYAPLYFYLAAALSKVVGAGYTSLRLVSILGTLGSFAVIYALIRGETGSPLAAIAGVGLFAASYSQLEAYFDVGRVDSLFVFLLLLAIYCTRRAPILLAVVVWLVALQVKQTALPVAVLIFFADWQRPRRMMVGLAALLAGFAASILVMNHLTGGWYSYYLFGFTKGLPWVLRTFVLYIPSDLLLPLGTAFLIGLASLLCVSPRLLSRSTQFYLVVSFAIYASIWYLRGHLGSTTDTLTPAYAWTAVLFGIAIGRLRPWLSGLASPHAQLCQTLLLTAATIQIVGFIYHPGRYDPGTSTREAREKFEQQLRSLPGDVYVVAHSYDAIEAGKQPHAFIDAFGIILDSGPSPTRSAFIADFQRAIDAHVYNGFVLDDTADAYKPGVGWMPADFLDQYPIRLLADSFDVSSAKTEPVEKWIYLPCSVLDHDTSSFITPASTISYGTCPNAPSIQNK